MSRAVPDLTRDDPHQPDEATARANREHSRAALEPDARRGLAALTVTAMSNGGLPPQEPTGGQLGVARGPRTACYWCGVYLIPGTEVWVYRERAAQRGGCYAHVSCHDGSQRQ